MARDLRQWIQQLEEAGELRRVRAEVDWNLEIGAVTRRTFDLGGPALLFENIKGYQQGRCRRLFTGSLATKGRLGRALGLEGATDRELIRHVRERFRQRIKPVEVRGGPVKEVVVRDGIDLEELPVPRWHERDGGRYINTTGLVVTRDPDTGWLNAGIYRGMIVGPDRIATGIGPAQHAGRMLWKHRDRAQPMPVAVVYGGDPLLFFVGSAAVPAGVCEYEVLGALRGQPLELVRCETSDLLVPAHAEIVVEGYISPDPSTYAMEGPFGEYTGYYGGARSPKPVIQVTCITHRRDPIFQGTLEGYGPGHPNEDGTCMQISLSAWVFNALQEAGVPGVLDVYMLPASCANVAAVRIRKAYQGHAKQVAFAVWAAFPYWQCKHVIVVDEDIDVFSLEALEWAIAYRMNPARDDLVVVHGTPGSPLDPSVPLEERGDFVRLGAGRWSRVLVDATEDWLLPPRPEWDGRRYPPLAFELSPELQRLVEQRWREYGI